MARVIFGWSLSLFVCLLLANTRLFLMCLLNPRTTVNMIQNIDISQVNKVCNIWLAVHKVRPSKDINAKRNERVLDQYRSLLKLSYLKLADNIVLIL